MVVIKKYGNRKMYNTENSSYVNLSTIKELILECTCFKIIDNDTQENITNKVLADVVAKVLKDTVTNSRAITVALTNIIIGAI